VDGGDAAEPVRRLGWAYWREVERFTFGLVRARQGPPAIADFFPALAARPGEPDSTGALYSQVQWRLHLAISRR
jgi:hypothetical protein